MEDQNNFKFNIKVPESPNKFGTRHIQTILLSISLLIAYGMRASISVAVVAMTNSTSTNPDFREYKWSTSEKSYILSSFLWGYAVSQIPSGHLASIWSAHKLFSVGFFLSGVLNLTTPFLADYGGWIAVCVSRVIMGLLQACFLSSTHTLTSKWSPPLERSRLSTYAYSGTYLGHVIAFALSGLIAASPLGWPGIFYTFGIASIIMSIIFYMNASDSPATHPKISQEEKIYIMESLRQEENQEKKKPRPPWTKIITSFPMWAIIIAHCGVNWGSWTIQTGIPQYVQSILHFGITENGLVSSLYYVTCWISSFFVSWLADYSIHKGVSISVTRRVSNTIGTWGPGLALIILCFVDNLGNIWPIAMLGIAGALKAGVNSGFNVNHIDLSPNFAGPMYAVSNCLGTIVSILAPILCGTIVNDSKEAGPWHIVFFIASGVYFITNLIFIIFARGKIQPWNDINKRVSIVSIYDPGVITMDL